MSDTFPPGDMLVTNARVVTREDMFKGSVLVEHGQIQVVEQGRTSFRAADNWEGDYLIPGLIELHTDNLEKHLIPRPGVDWPMMSALLAHDAQVAASGITTVLDALGLGDLDACNLRTRTLKPFTEALEAARADNLLRAEHLLHLRCEIAVTNAVDLFEPFAENPLLRPLVRLVSLMDHTPGQRQWTDLDKYRQYTERHGALSDEAFRDLIEQRLALQQQNSQPNRSRLVERCQALDIPLASHDDTLTQHVEEAIAEGIAISEFPTTQPAAELARSRGMGIVMGAPNVVRGGSHSGNVSALDLAREGLLDGLSSDYVPASLLHAAFLLKAQAGWSLPRAIATVTANPAKMVRLEDRGEVAPGKRADLVRVRELGGTPVVMGAWREGIRIL
jgi:alpha-D-ribose 1-methylphosphonate 5-triphosphate diphosphatase